MGQKLYKETESGGIRFISRRKGEVRIPNYVYDLWLPLLGATAIGVYSMYCRLEREDVVKAMTQKRIAKMCRIGTEKLAAINQMLEDCGFVSITKPEGYKKLMHWTTEIEIFDPEEEISPMLIERYQPPSGYECLSPWLVSPETTETLDGSLEDPIEKCDKTPNGDANVVSLGLNPLEVELAAKVAPESTDSNPLTKSPEPCTITVIDAGYIYEHCPWCENDILLSDLSKSAAICPHCKTPLWVRNTDGEAICKPPQEYRRARKKKVIGDIIDKCPDNLADIIYYAKDKLTVKTFVGENREMFLECLDWAANKMAHGKMAPNKVVSSAIAYMHKRVKAMPAQPPQSKEKKIDPKSIKVTMPDFML